MAQLTLDQLRFPIGPFERKEIYTDADLAEMLQTIAAAPAQYRQIAAGLSPGDFQKTYRPGAWTIAQLLHHIADTQLLHYLRLKKTVTEPMGGEVTMIDIDAWANTPDATQAPVADSLDLLESVVKKYLYLARTLNEAQRMKSNFHPVRGYTINADQIVAMSAWHLLHHLKHIEIALEG